MPTYLIIALYYLDDFFRNLRHYSQKYHCMLKLFHLYKYILHLLTGHSELDRICLYTLNGFVNLTEIADDAIFTSTRLEQHIKRRLANHTPGDIHLALKTLLLFKRVRQEYKDALKFHLLSILAMNELIATLDTMSRQKVDGTNYADYSTDFQCIWNAINSTGDTRYKIPDDSWRAIGFQNKYPHSDLRGAGWLGLTQISHLAKTEPGLLHRLQAPGCKIDVAIYSLNLTAMLLRQARMRNLGFYFYRYAQLSLNAFSELHRHIFVMYLQAENSRQGALDAVEMGNCFRKFLKDVEDNIVARRFGYLGAAR